MTKQAGAALLLALPFTLAWLPACAAPRQASFATPTEAVWTLFEAGGDSQAVEAVLGPGSATLMHSGDDVADREDREYVGGLLQERLAFEDGGDGRTWVLLGDVGWELPIPLVRESGEESGRWGFDTPAGREEIQNRRVGRKELSTLATLRALVTAQREYAAEGRDGNPPAFAQRLLSRPGRHDGLYWEAAPGEPESPIGPLLAEATHEGYRFGGPDPVPFHGYYYRLLTAQGANAPGGARNYLDERGRLTGGFALLAWPAQYDNSGVMTFLVGPLGLVAMKDLGPESARLAAEIRVYDPDPSWKPAED